jgi:hypothetical protein
MGPETAQALQTYASLALTVLTAATLVVLVVYTVETYRLRKTAQAQTAETASLLREAQTQNELSLLPIVTLAPGKLTLEVNIMSEMMHPVKSSIDKLVVRNVGSGPAFNAFTASITEGRTVLGFHHKAALAAGEEHFVDIELKDAGTSTPLKTLGQFKEALQDLGPQTTVSNRIIYMSAAGKWYQTSHTFRVSPESKHLVISLDSFQHIPEPRSSPDATPRP